jgi:hypothetical protein
LNRTCIAFFGLVCLGALGASHGCRQETADEPGDPAVEVAATGPIGTVVFPEAHHVQDESVNEFLDHAMTVCTAGDYGAFRLLWSAREEPLPREEFEKGWQAMLDIRVRALEKVLFAKEKKAEDPAAMRSAYAFYADVHLDPAQLTSDQKPERQVVLMLVREHSGWRLAKAPREVRAWLENKVNGPPTGGHDETQPNGPQARDGD